MAKQLSLNRSRRRLECALTRYINHPGQDEWVKDFMRRFSACLQIAREMHRAPSQEVKDHLMEECIAFMFVGDRDPDEPRPIDYQN
jgi:hypothetical protein